MILFVLILQMDYYIVYNIDFTVHFFLFASSYVCSEWRDDGCSMRETNLTHTVCECNHLTNFAVLMDVRAVPIDPSHQVALEIITYVGCIISVICLVLAIITFQLFLNLKVYFNILITQIINFSIYDSLLY